MLKSQVLTLQPFQNDIEETRDAGRTISNEWVLNLRLSSNHYFDYSSQVGRKELAQEDKDAYDVPALPVMDSFVAVRTEINGNGDFDYESDIRSLEESNGVWNIKLISEGISGPYTFSMKSNNDLPAGLDFALLDIPNKNTIQMIKKRTFGPNININIILQDIYLENLFNFGLIPLMKHIPGHGVTNKDSHLTMPISNLSNISLSNHIKIFKHFNTLPLAMTAHIKYLSWDQNYIATFSKIIINEIIRNKIGFKGLIMTDDLVMNANTYDIEESINLSNNSRIDIMLDCSSNWSKYSKIIDTFNVSKNYTRFYKLKMLRKYNPRINLESININQYHHLYNQLVRTHGI